MSPERAIRYRREGREADGPRRRARRGASGEGCRRSRFCMGAAWRAPKDRDLNSVCAMVRAVKALGLGPARRSACSRRRRRRRLKAAGLDYYNHNLDTSPEYYGAIITTRTYQDRLDTLEHVRAAGMQRVLRRHRRHGGGHRGPRRDDRDAGKPAGASGKRADQHAGAGLKARRSRAGRNSIRNGVRPHHRRCAHHHAEIGGAPLRRARGDERRDAGAVLSRRRQLDLLRAEAAHDAQPRPRPRPRLWRSSASRRW